MRPLAAIVAIAGLALFGAAIVTTGAGLQGPGFEVSDEDVASIEMSDDVGGLSSADEVEPSQDATPEDLAGTSPEADQQIAQDGAAPAPNAPQSDPNAGLERIAPRPPLSDLSTPAAPKPPAPVPRQPQRLFNPTATAAGIIEAKGRRVALSGIEPLGADEKCDWQGASWPCGVQARTAFRSWLRNRAVMCKLPPVADREAIVANCRVGNDDPSKWLVENGWARAAAGGDYAELGRKAEDARRGLFGPPPSRALPSLPRLQAPSVEAAPGGSILATEPQTPAPDVVSPAPPSATEPGFPPAPAVTPSVETPAQAPAPPQ